MNKDDLIAKQQLQIEEYKQMFQKNTKLKRKLKMMFYAIGQPLNDNILQFNKEQQRWCFQVVELVEQLNGL